MCGLVPRAIGGDILGMLVAAAATALLKEMLEQIAKLRGNEERSCQ